jgi:hypothetical protein
LAAASAGDGRAPAPPGVTPRRIHITLWFPATLCTSIAAGDEAGAAGAEDAAARLMLTGVDATAPSFDMALRGAVAEIHAGMCVIGFPWTSVNMCLVHLRARGTVEGVAVARAACPAAAAVGWHPRETCGHCWHNMLAITLTLNQGAMTLGMSRIVLALMAAAGDPSSGGGGAREYGLREAAAFGLAHGAHLWDGHVGTTLDIFLGLSSRLRAYLELLYLGTACLDAPVGPVPLPAPPRAAAAGEDAWHPHAHLISLPQLQALIDLNIVSWGGGGAAPPALTEDARAALRRAEVLFLCGGSSAVAHACAAGLMPTAAPEPTVVPRVPSAVTCSAVARAKAWEARVLGECAPRPDDRRTDVIMELCREVLDFAPDEEYGAVPRARRG